MPPLLLLLLVLRVRREKAYVSPLTNLPTLLLQLQVRLLKPGPLRLDPVTDGRRFRDGRDVSVSQGERRRRRWR